MATAKVKDIKVACAPGVVWNLCLEYFGSQDYWTVDEVDEPNAQIWASRKVGGSASTRAKKMFSLKPKALVLSAATMGASNLISAARAKDELGFSVTVKPGGVVAPNDSYVRSPQQKTAQSSIPARKTKRHSTRSKAG